MGKLKPSKRFSNSIVNQFMQNDFLCLRLTVISQPYPFHLAGIGAF
jgi:hypothetical protein